VRQSKRQPIVELGTGIYLRTIKFSTFTLFYQFTYLLPCSAMLTRSPLLCWEVPAGTGSLGRKLCQLMLCSCLQLPVPDVSCQGPWGISQHCLSSQTSRKFPPVMIVTFSFPGPLISLRPLVRNPLFWHPALLSGTQFSHLNSVCIEVQRVIHFLTNGWTSYIFL